MYVISMKKPASKFFTAANVVAFCRWAAVPFFWGAFFFFGITLAILFFIGADFVGVLRASVWYLLVGLLASLALAVIIRETYFDVDGG